MYDRIPRQMVFQFGTGIAVNLSMTEIRYTNKSLNRVPVHFAWAVLVIFVFQLFSQVSFGARGLISMANGQSIDCTRVHTFSNAEYRQIKSVFQFTDFKMAELIYSTSKDRPYIEALAPYRHAQNLNYPELYAILGYTGGAYIPINRALWQKNSFELERLSVAIRVLCSGLSKLPNFVGEVSRGTSEPGELAFLQEGEIYTPTGFLSTSMGFAAQLYKKLPVQMKILSKNGKQIDVLSSYGEDAVRPEREVLFVPESNFRILKKVVTTKPGGRVHYDILLEEVDPSTEPNSVFESAGKLQISGLVTRTSSFMSSSEENANEDALAQCQSEKEENDILGDCFLDCSSSNKSTSCRWIASDWFHLNPMTLQKSFDNFFEGI